MKDIHYLQLLITLLCLTKLEEHLNFKTRHTSISLVNKLTFHKKKIIVTYRTKVRTSHLKKQIIKQGFKTGEGERAKRRKVFAVCHRTYIFRGLTADDIWDKPLKQHHFQIMCWSDFATWWLWISLLFLNQILRLIQVTVWV